MAGGNRFVGLYAAARRAGLTRLPGFPLAFRHAYFLYKRLLEDPFAALLRRQPGLLGSGHVLDVGANIGYTAQLFARHLAPGRRVYAFEPESANFRELASLVDDRRLGEIVRPVQAAVGAASGETEIWINPDHHADHRVVTDTLRRGLAPASATQRVPLVALDDFARAENIAGAISFVKIDVQGYELQVARGMARVLQENPGLRVALEYSPEQIAAMGDDTAALLALFREQGYAGSVIERSGELTALAAGLLEARLAERGYINLLFSRG